mmetsp:Transcript_38462/g.121616  ORF Transcript_38462/g.121616 Transcript_38462/m.121616 type:complete len:107 (+) Transcript_38462:356-676(+)
MLSLVDSLFEGCSTEEDLGFANDVRLHIRTQVRPAAPPRPPPCPPRAQLSFGGARLASAPGRWEGRVVLTVMHAPGRAQAVLQPTYTVKTVKELNADVGVTIIFYV